MRNTEVYENQKDIIYEPADLRHLEWSRMRKSSGTAGSFLKSYEMSEGKKYYYKLSDFDSVKGIVGHECVNEIIAARLLTKLGIEHLEYTLLHGLIKIQGREYMTYLCRSEDFKKPGESKLAIEDFYQAESMPGEDVVDFCVRLGWKEYIDKMLIVDFLILNRDRHGANIEVLRDSKRRTLRLAPLYDQGLSLMCRCHNADELEDVDVMEDKRVQSFVGGSSVLDNLRLIDKRSFKTLTRLIKDDREYIMAGISEILPQEFENKAWEMIWTRWKYLEAFCNT